MPHPILQEDWSLYNNRKTRDHLDPAQFSGESAWEVNWLVSKLRKYFPLKTDYSIRMAIETCRESMPAPHDRALFVECVVERLS